jgi:hypothetical protein
MCSVLTSVVLCATFAAWALQAYDFLVLEQDLEGKRNLSRVLYFNVVRAGAVNAFHPVRGDMFIDRGTEPFRLRSEERNSS